MSKQADAIEEEIDKALRRCSSLTAEGLWRRMRFLMEHDSDRRPYARHDATPVTTTEQLSNATGCSVVKVSVALPRLIAQGLVKESPEGYYSPKIQRILEVRSGNARRKRDSVARKPGRHQRVTDRVLPHTPEGVTSQQGSAQVTSGTPPALSPSPTPPTSIPPTPKIPFPSGTAAVVASPDEPGKKRAKAKDPVFPPGVWARAVEGWGNAYRHVHGVAPTPEPRGLRGLSAMLTALNCDLDALANVIRAGLREPDRGIWQGHKLSVISDNFDYLRGKVAKGTVGHGAAKPTAADRGEFPEAPGRLKILNA